MPQAPLLSDPPTDKKPPVGPASIRPFSSSEKTSGKPVLQSQAVQLKAERPEPDKVAVCTALVPPSRTEAQIGAANPAPQSNTEDPAPSAAGMKSRLKNLAEQRKCWNTDGNSFLLFNLHRMSLNLQEVINRTSGGGGDKMIRNKYKLVWDKRSPSWDNSSWGNRHEIGSTKKCVWISVYVESPRCGIFDHFSQLL